MLTHIVAIVLQSKLLYKILFSNHFYYILLDSALTVLCCCWDQMMEMLLCCLDMQRRRSSLSVLQVSVSVNIPQLSTWQDSGSCFLMHIVYATS